MATNYSEIRNHLDSESSALYFLNSFIIRLPAGNRALKDEEPPLIDFCVFVHEYIHYLQNAATLSGLYDFVFQLRLIYLFGLTLDESRHSSGSHVLPIDVRNSIEQLLLLQSILRGDRSPLDPGYKVHRSGVRLKVLNVEVSHSQVSVPETVETTQVVLHIEAESDRNSPTQHTMHFGTHCLNEGLAWEIERNLLLSKLSPDEVNEISPQHPAPYEVMRAVYEWYMGPQESSRNMICAGSIALQSFSPAESFIQICELLKEQGPLSHDADFPDEIVKKMQSQLGNIDQMFLEMVDPIMKNFAGLGPLKPAIVALQNNYKGFIEMRLNNPFIELELIESRTDLQTVVNLLQTMPPCPVIQTSDDPDEDGRPETITWFAGHMEMADSEAYQAILEGLGIYQSMNAFVKTHLANTRIISTQELENNIGNEAVVRRICCPFVNSCGAPQALATPEICRERPWESPKDPLGACWYAVGSVILQIGAPVFMRPNVGN